MSKKEVLNFSIKSHTLKGLRPTNQDTVIFAKSQDKSQLAIIADGIGSLPNSEKCSEIICKVFVDCFKNRNINNYSKWFKETLQECHCKIVEYSKQNLNNQNIGSTIAVAIVKDDKLSFFHIGDTRIYLIRGHKVKQLTQDHNYKTFLLRKKASNKELVASMYKWKALTNFIDVMNPKMAIFEANSLTLKKGDFVWLSSDGCYDYVDGKSLKKILSDPKTSLAQKTALLNSLALSNGSNDNLSNIIIKVW